MSREPLHVTNGDSAAVTLRRTGLGGEVLAWQDVLHEGPVPGVGRDELLRLRAAFLSDCGFGDREAIRCSLADRDRRLVEALRSGRQVVFWFEHDLYDQLQLVDALSLSREADAAPELVVAGSFPGKPSFRGLGELSADELETLWPARQPASAGALAAAVEAWDAFRSPTPEALAVVATSASASPELPFLAPALARLLEELPAPRDGLSGSERRALQAVAAGARTAHAAFVAAQALEPAPFLGDTWFFRTLVGLGAGGGRLVETDDGRPLPPGAGGRPLRLTANGERALRGEADRIELLGVDRWLGGTHLTTKAHWRWDPGERRLAAPSPG